MKKPYEKPAILFESFAISTNIAGDCEFKTTLLGRNVCGYEPRGGLPGVVIFVHEIEGCTNKYKDDGDDYDTICYHVPTDAKELFNS